MIGIKDSKAKKFTVYMHIFPSTKKYIGITCQKAKQRWDRGRGYCNNQHFCRAIEKYGWDNIEHVIIAKGLTKKEACKIEIDLIKYWDTTNTNEGYNSSTGGEISGLGVKHTSTMNRNQSRRQLAEYGGCNANSKKVKQYSLDGTYIKTFASMRLAERKTGVLNGEISKACRNKAVYAKGYIWRFENDMDAHIIAAKIKNKRNVIGYKGAKRVDQFSLDGVFLQRYNSSQLAAEKNNLKYGGISNVCNGKQKTYGNFIWKYAKVIKGEQN